MQEETGYFPGHIEHLTSLYSAPGYSTELLHIYLTTELKPARLVAEDTYEITLLRASKSDILKMINDRTICDGKSVAALLFYINMR